MFLQWKSEYLVGHAIIDFDHQTLFNITNELFTYIEKGEGQDYIGKTINNLTDYIRRHFYREEAIFSNSDYPDILQHIEKHREIEKVVNKLAIAYAKDPASIKVDEVLLFLQKWLTSHILRSDHDYIPFI